MCKTIIISDTHIGDPRNNSDNLVNELLQRETFDRLVLNGDIIDLWLTSWKKASKSLFIQTIKQISEIKEVIWVIGNHDYKILKNNISSILPKVLITEFYNMTDGGKHFLMLHGHQVYKKKDKSLGLRLLSKMNSLIWKYLKIDLQKVHDAGKYYTAYINRKRKKIIKKFGSGYDIVICSHTHEIGHLIVDKIELFDTGAFVKQRSFVIIEDGKVSYSSLY